MFDLISTVSLTAVSVVLIVVLTTIFGTTVRARVVIALALGAWFLAVLMVGTIGLLDVRRWAGIAGLGLAVGMPVTILATLACGTRVGLERVVAASLPLLIGTQTIRLVGICFVLLYAAHRLTAPFAPVAGWGDILVGILAPPVAFAAGRSPAAARTPILAWNTLGLLDILAAVVLGTMSAPGPTQIFTAPPDPQFMTSAPWIFITCFLVPVNAVVHLMIFAKMRTGNATQQGTFALP